MKAVQNPVAYMMQTLKEEIIAAAKAAQSEGKLPEGEMDDFVVEIPKDAANGDFATNFAMKHARVFRQAPQKIASEICEKLKDNAFVKIVSVAGAGFINFVMNEKYDELILQSVLQAGENYGRTNHFDGEKVMVEFVSANPTGPMHMGNARGGIIGDCLSEMLSWAGADVHREFYVNDAGNQVALFGNSLYVRYYQLVHGEDSMEFPEDGYHGKDIKALAAAYHAEHGDGALDEGREELTKKLVEFGLKHNIAKMQADLAKYKIEYDCWFRESSLHNSGYVAETVAKLEEMGALYEKEGAKWFKASEYGCEKDEVLVKANGFYTYFAVDIAYHRNKFEKRQFERVIDVFGADHHGHTLRFWAAMRALGLDESRLQFVLMQLVRLMKDGQPVVMSKRTGNSITLSDLLDEIPVDAARFFFNSRQSDSAMDFDLGLATRQDSENPLYYVQYAHARICSILRNLAEEGITSLEGAKAALLSTKEEKELLRMVAALPQEIVSAASSLEASRITGYCVTLAAAFHRFYNACRIKGEAEELCKARLALCVITAQTLKNALHLMNIEAPEKM